MLSLYATLFVCFLYVVSWVIERYQNENGSGGRSSGIHSASASPSPSERSSPRSLNSRSRRDIRDITPPLHEEDEVIEWEDGGAEEPIELPRRVPFPEYGGDIIHPTENDFRDFDEVSGSDIQAVDGSWEENWLFQKKKINTIQSVPVPMLVPNSNTDYKALIGDRDADDTTDLSDNASEDEGDVEYKSDVKRVLDSKHIIGGQPKLEELDFEPDSLTIVNGNESEDMLDSIENIIDDDNNENLNNKEIIHSNNDSHDSIMVIGVNSGPISKTEFNLKEEIHRTVENGDRDGIDDDTSEPYSIGADIKCSESSFTYTSTPSINTLSRHEREGEYEETVSVPVQRYADSLRRKHFDVETDSQVTRDGAEDLIPGSIAYRERKKWLNYVDMPNNPYSPEAIQKRLSAKSTSSLFDGMTSRNNTNEQNNSMTHDDDSKMEPDSLDILEDNKNELTKSATTDCVSDRRSESPSPRVLKDVLSEEIPQYKRYGRDYYIKEAKSSSGGRKYNHNETSSVTSSVNKSTSLDNFDTEFASPVSASSSLSDLEATALHQNIVRAVLSPRNASPNFAINPIFENPDRLDSKDKTADAVERDEVRPRNTNTNGGDGYVENEDIVRLKIPLKPEITEDLFETYTKVRRSNTMRSEDYYVRAKRRPALNFALGGSLRLNKGFRTNLW